MKTHSITLQRYLKLSLALAAASLCGTGMAASDTAVASGTVIQPIAVAKSTDLVFGKFAAGAGGTITVSTNGSRTTSGVITSSSGAAPSAARFNVTGETGATYTITHSGTTTLTNTTGSGGETMVLTKFSDLNAAGATTGTATAGTLTAGAESIYVGGTLAVAAAQVPGVYAGSIIVTVEYN